MSQPKPRPLPPTPDEARAFRQQLPKREFPAIWFSEAELPAAAPWIVKGLIAPGDLALIYGPSQSGKTFLVADLVFSVAAGMPWRGRQVLPGLVVYVAPEAGTSIIKRFVALRENRLPELTEARVPLAILTRGPNLLDTLDVEALLEQLRVLSTEAGRPVGMVVFDTLSRSIPGGDENRSEDMTALIAVADRLRDDLQAATVLIHHSGKDSQKGARGHSSLFAAADLVLSIAGGAATVEKIRDGVAGEQFAFKLDPVVLGEDADGDAITTCLVNHVDAPITTVKRPDAALPGVAKVALQALREALSARGEALPETSTIPRGTRGVTIAQWRDQFRVRYGEGDEQRDADAVRKAFQRAREALLKVSAVAISNPYVWVTR